MTGVEFEYGTAVEKIMADGYETKGVVLEDGRCLNADFIVANDVSRRDIGFDGDDNEVVIFAGKVPGFPGGVDFVFGP